MFGRKTESKPSKAETEEFIDQFRRHFKGAMAISQCCGVLEVGGWKYFQESQLLRFRDAIVEYIKRYVEPQWTDKGVVFTTMNQDQRKSVVPIVQALGFEFSGGKGVNQRHGNAVFLWVKNINSTTKTHLVPRI